ncbi:uroporphyrinogen-III C-methyltransferase [soil metagenome]
MSEEHEPRVFIVGAGPGSPGLLTLRAAEVLAKADLVLYDQLVPPRLLDFAKPTAERICVRELPGNHPDKYPYIHQLLIDRARRGQTVVRLKGGDPLIFGRGGEESDALRDAGILYEIVPGITAALAAAAFLDIPLTHRHISSAVAFVTGHELPMKPGNKLDWKALAAFPGTLAIYMGIARLPLIIAELTKYGKDPATPAAIVERASTGDMRTIVTTLINLDKDRRAAGLEAPGLILIGEAVRHRANVSWFESRPLFGKRVLVTRPTHQARNLIHRLEKLGAVAYHLPTMTMKDPADWGPVDNVIDTLNKSDAWLVFTSANGVTHFFKRLFERGHDLRLLGRTKLAAIGPATAAALAEFKLTPDVVPGEDYSSEKLAAMLALHVRGQRVILARADRGRDLLRSELAKIADVTPIVVYEQHDSVLTDHAVFDHLRRGEIEFVTLTSANVAKGLLSVCDDVIRGRIERGDIKLIANSPQTTSMIRSLGYPVAAEAKAATDGAMISELIDLAGLTKLAADAV